MEELGAFWIIGIVLNVGFAILGLLWVYKIMRKPKEDSEGHHDQKS